MTGIIPAQATVAPLPEQNQVDAVGQVSAQSIARQVVQAHSVALQSRRDRDLISEKLLLHVDGSSDGQWYDIFLGQRVEIPRLISEFRKTENILRLVVDNAVAHHTTMPLRYFAESQPDRDAADQALIDSLWMNYVAYTQDLNSLFAEAMYLAMPAGFCPVHRYWSDGVTDQHEPVKPQGEEATQMDSFNPTPGVLDCWLGNPFDMVFDRNAKRGSVYWASYGRVLPADLVRRTFSHVPGVDGLEGSTRMPSASRFQQIARDWQTEGIGVHGSSAISHRRSFEGEEESLTLIVREALPIGWGDRGHLQIVAVPGNVDLRRGEGTAGHALLLADQALPGLDFSWSLFYSHHRGDDVHGKPWVEDIDQLQVDLNIALSKRWEVINRMVEAPIVAPGGAISEDMADLGGYNLLEVEPTLAGWRPQVMQWPYQILDALNKECEDRRRAIYTGGGYQASSRGEAPGSRMAYRAIVALQQADNSIHGPVNMRFRRSATDFARGCWRQMKQYGQVPWLIDIAGDEYSHLVEPYVDNTKISDRPPHYKLVNAFGASPELRAQEILDLMGTRGADGEVFLSTAEARRRYPDQALFDGQGDPGVVARRRAKTVANRIRMLAKQFREQNDFQETDFSHPWVQQAAMMIFNQIEAQFPRLQDDDLAAHISTLSEITQDETVDPIARLAAIERQKLYYQWQAMMAMTPGMAPQGGIAAPGGQAPNAGGLNARNVMQEQKQLGSGTMVDEATAGPATAQG